MAIFNWFKKNKKNNMNEGEEQNIEQNISEEPLESLEEGIKNNFNEVFQEIEIEELADEDITQDEEENKIEELAEEDITQDKTEEIINQDNDEDKENNNAEEPKKEGFFEKIKKGISKTKDAILGSVENVLKCFTSVDEDLFEELEEALIMADMGVETSCAIIDKVREIAKKEKIKEPMEIKDIIIRVITEILEEDTEEFELKSPSVLLIIGVNGVGKTTTIGKLTNNYKKQGKKVILGAADTFRAAAIDQLQIWGERNNVDVIKHQENSDPAAVVFDAVQASKARKADLLICDTAGRLHNKKNLMEELKKIARVVAKEYEGAQVETLLVLDATTGQNALQQAKLFSEVANITGLVLTKLDGTAKGGIIISIKNELKIPVRFIGVGEGIDDLRPFNAKEFSAALFE